jgi:2-(1,2-epoxy-1,2-dihydrophenyl)acetyl-CoA isomerase
VEVPVTGPLLIDRDVGVATLTLNRPSSLNSLSVELKEALVAGLAEVRDDPAVRAVVLTGSGGAFCAGQDLREHAALLDSGDPAPLRTVAEHYNPITLGIAELPKPVVAAVRGMAAGAGAGFAFAADLRIGGPSTRILLAFAAVGLAGDSGVTWTLQRLAGYGKATELLLLGTPLDATAALSAGLLTEVVPTDEDVLPRAHDLAARLASGPSVAFAQIKRCLRIAASSPLAEALDAEAEAQALCGTTTDHRTATHAFLTKQTPTFTGH